jgi:RNA polymerase sigma factor (sigma-70 family)
VARPHGLRLPKPRRVLAALSDERLVERVRHGDGVAFEILYDRHHRGILAFCRHMLRSADEAEDAVQHTFIAAYNDLQRDTGRDIRFKAWLYTIARNRCLSILRARREQASDDIELTVDRLSDDVQHRADLQALLGDIAGLPEDQREALVLSEVGDFSHADIAAVIGCEAAKVKSLVFQARTALMDRRQARETPCEEIREQLATLRGGALRRSHLRHHLASCPGCTQYRDEIRRQRQMLAIALPVLPSIALKHNVLAAVGAAGGTAVGGAAGIGGGISVLAKSGLAKVGVAAVIAAGGAGTAVVATQGGDLPVIGDDSAPAGQKAETGSAGAPGAPGGGQPGALAGTDTTTTTSTTEDGKGGRRSDKGSEHGFTPTQGGSSGDAARQFAKTRGKGRKKGLYKTHRTKTRVKRVRTRHRRLKVKVKRVPTRTTPTTPTRTTPTRTTPTRTQAQTSPAPTETTTSPTTTTTTAPTSTTPSDGGKGGARDGGKGAASLLP